MLLAIDQGNSDVVFGLHHQSDWIHQWRTPTTNKNASHYEAIMRQWLLDANVSPSAIREVVISSVVPENKETIVTFAENFFRISPLILFEDVYNRLGLKLNSPHEIGSDLVANAMAATHHYPGIHCLIVDFGTALTLTSAHETAILGVSIAPGLKTAVKSLFSHTAQLPEVPLELPDSVLGKNTIHAIQTGVLHGYIGLVRHLVAETRRELNAESKVVATGGLSSILNPLHDIFDTIDPLLTLKGLKVIHDKLSKTK